MLFTGDSQVAYSQDVSTTRKVKLNKKIRCPDCRHNMQSGLFGISRVHSYSDLKCDHRGECCVDRNNVVVVSDYYLLL